MLTRQSLARVLQSLLTAELMNARGRSLKGLLAKEVQADRWPDELRIAESAFPSLSCDSLEMLWLAAATNEMFNLYESKRETDLLAAPTFGEWLDVVQAAWESGVDRITFSTSGSAGAPRRCTHEFRYLETEIAFLGKVFLGRRRILSFVPAHHIYGFLFTAMLPDFLGIESLSGVAMGPGQLCDSLRDSDLLVSVPDVWHWLDRSLPVWPPGIHGVVSTAPCPTTVLRSLMERGMERMTEVYGSTETAGVALRIWPQPYYQLMPQWELIRSGEADASLMHSSGKAFQSMDRLSAQSKDTFILEGRLDEAVQVGGVNVYPGQVATSLRLMPGVRDVSVRLMRPEEGNRLKAFVVPDPEIDLSLLEQEFRAWAATHLTTVETPRLIQFGTTLPRNPIGKLCDW